MFPKLLLPILILIPLAVLVFVFLTPSQSSPSPLGQLAPPAGGEPTTQNPQPASSSVTVSAEYLPALPAEASAEAGRSSAEFIVFQISLNTHSVGLDNIDFQKSVVLEKSGQKISPLEVNTEGSGHHRSAEVKFNRTDPPFKIIFLDTPEVSQQEFELDVKYQILTLP